MTPVIGKTEFKVWSPTGILRKDFGLQETKEKNHDYCILP